MTATKVFRMNAIACALLAAFCAGCTRPDHAEKVLSQAGYKNIQITGYKPFACDDKSDDFSTGFTAISPTGAHVSGAVCEGILKGATIRFD